MNRNKVRESSVCAPLTGAVILGALLVAIPTGVRGEPTRELYISDPEEVMQGDPVTTSIDALGGVTPGPKIVGRGPALGRPISAMASSRDGLWVGTAGGGLHLIEEGQAATELMKGDEKLISAVLPTGSRAWVALAPDAELYRVEPGRAAQSVVKLKSKYVWAIRKGKNRTLLATGEPGQVVAVDDDNRTEIWFDSDETHLRALIRHPQRGWIVGGGQKGIVYQLVGNRTARALYDSKFEEVSAFAIDRRRGDLYAAFVSAETAGAPLPGRWIGPTNGEKPKKDRSPFKGSEVVRIRPSGQVEVLWSSNTEGAMALAFHADRLYFATGTAAENRARVYAIDVKDRDRLSLWARLEPALAPVMVLDDRDGLLVGTAPNGQVYKIGPGFETPATYLSVEQDLSRTGKVGQLWFDADVPQGGQVAISVRSGNTEKPDETWSAWSGAVTRPEGGPVAVPDARYLQLRAVLTSGKGGRRPRLKSMHASVLRHNVAPTIQDIFPLWRGVSLSPLPNEAATTKTVTLNERTLNQLRRPPVEKKTVRARQVVEPGMMTVLWQANDADGDDLLYKVEMRSVEPTEGRWRELARGQQAPFLAFDSRAYPDGRYQFRVTATDRPSNPPREALTDQHASDPILIDNTAPRLTKARAKSPGPGRLRVSATVTDALSRIESAELSVNGGPWLMFPAADGLLDSRSENLSVELSDADMTETPVGPTTVRIRVLDEAGNGASGSAKTDVARP